MKTHAELLFLSFNERYFDGRLSPMVKISYAKKHLSQWAVFKAHVFKGESITLSPILKNYQMALEGVILHEMIHAFLWYNRNPAWMEHTPEFLEMEMTLNRRHFGNIHGHKKYFDLMRQDLTKR